MSDKQKHKVSRRSNFKTINISGETKTNLELLKKQTGKKIFVICEDAIEHYIEDFYPEVRGSK